METFDAFSIDSEQPAYIQIAFIHTITDSHHHHRRRYSKVSSSVCFCVSWVAITRAIAYLDVCLFICLKWHEIYRCAVFISLISVKSIWETTKNNCNSFSQFKREARRKEITKKKQIYKILGFFFHKVTHTVSVISRANQNWIINIPGALQMLWMKFCAFIFFCFPPRTQLFVDYLSSVETFIAWA